MRRSSRRKRLPLPECSKIVKDQRENSSISKQSPRPLEELVAVPNVTAITEDKRTPGRALSISIMAAQASRQ